MNPDAELMSESCMGCFRCSLWRTLDQGGAGVSLTLSSMCVCARGRGLTLQDGPWAVSLEQRQSRSWRSHSPGNGENGRSTGPESDFLWVSELLQFELCLNGRIASQKHQIQHTFRWPGLYLKKLNQCCSVHREKIRHRSHQGRKNQIWVVSQTDF